MNHPRLSFSRFVLLLCSILLMTSGSACKLFKSKTETRSERAWRSILKGVETARPEFETMSINGRANIYIPGGEMEHVSASYRMYIAKDSVILLRVSKIIELARVLITPDSIFIRNNLEETLTVADYSLAEEYTGLQADFGLLQDLFLGNFHPVPTEIRYQGEEMGRVRFDGEKSGTKFSYTIDKALVKLVGMRADQPAKAMSSTITYADFISVGKQSIPQEVTIDVSAEQPLTIGFQHKKIQIDPDRISFLFPVPDHYERIELR